MLLLVTGASGVGKSTCRIAIEAALGDELDCVELRDVVAIPAAPDVAWRQRSVEAVVQRALSGDRDLLLAGDPVAPGELIAAPSADRLDRIAVCLLDCDASSQTQRARGHHRQRLGRDALGAPGARRLVVRRDRHERASARRCGGGRARVGPGRPGLSTDWMSSCGDGFPRHHTARAELGNAAARRR